MKRKDSSKRNPQALEKESSPKKRVSLEEELINLLKKRGLIEGRSLDLQKGSKKRGYFNGKKINLFGRPFVVEKKIYVRKN